MGGFLAGAGEILPLIEDDSGEELYLLNVTTCYNALDPDDTTFYWLRNPIAGQPAIRGHILNYAFHEGRLEEAVPFKIPENPGTHIFCDSGRVSPGDEFYSTYIDSGLTGLEFEEVWSKDYKKN